MDIPIFQAIISDDDDAGIYAVALVDKPAIKRNFMAFADVHKFTITSEDRRIVSGPLMLADVPIYRRDENIGEYYLVFSADEIYKGVQRFFARGRQNNLNINHNGNLIVEGATMFESWVVDRQRGVLPMQGFNDVKDGSWFGSFIINNEAAWQGIKSGDLRGFSIEGLLDAKRVVMQSQKSVLESIADILDRVDWAEN